METCKGLVCISHIRRLNNSLVLSFFPGVQAVQITDINVVKASSDSWHAVEALRSNVIKPKEILASQW